MDIDTTNKPSDSERETFEQSYRNFIDALEVLAKNPEEQCNIMGWYNVAWELKDDISTGRFLLKVSRGYLSDSEQNSISNLLTEIEKLPKEIFHESKTEKENLKSMRNTHWVAVRILANELIEILKPATAKNESFFEIN